MGDVVALRKPGAEDSTALWERYVLAITRWQARRSVEAAEQVAAARDFAMAYAPGAAEDLTALLRRDLVAVCVA